MHNFLSELIIKYVTTCLTDGTNKFYSLRSYLKVCSRLKSRNYVFKEAFSPHSSGIIQSKHIKESILLFRTVIILSDVNIAKNSDCDISDVIALFGCLITNLAAILNFLH